MSSCPTCRSTTPPLRDAQGNLKCPACGYTAAQANTFAAQPVVDGRAAKGRQSSNAALSLGLLAAGAGALNLVLALLGTGFMVLGLSSIAGIVAVVLGIVGLVKARKAQDKVHARNSGLGIGLGVLGLVLFVGSLGLNAGLADATIADHERVEVPAGQAYALGFLTKGSGTWRVDYTVQGQASDSFTSCIIPDSTAQQWVDSATPGYANGEACAGPTASATKTATVSKGEYDLIISCWNQSKPCVLTVTLTLDG